MKKIILVFLLIFCSTNVYASTIVMDKDTLRVLYGINEQEERLIASTTKIMTFMVVVNNTDNIKEKVKVTDSVLKSHGSNIYISIDEIITIEDLLYGLMLRSGNDAAIMLAEHIGGSIEGFTKLMNETAVNLGMFNTNFINPSGLEDNLGNGNTSNCYDLAILMSYALNNETFRRITGTKEKVVKTNLKTYKWTNKNKLLFNYKYTISGKTGYTKKAKRTLVTAATKDNEFLIIVTLNQPNDFEIHQNLYEEYFNKYKKYKIIDKNKFLKDKNHYIKNDIYMLLTEEEYKNIKIDVIYTNDILNRVGYVTISLDDKIYIKEDIFIKEIPKKSILDKIKQFLLNIFKN